jgi:sec-independent protein translocase protein TatA
MQSIALFSNLAGPEGLLIFFVVLLLFGAKKLPELARGLGQAVKEFSKAKEDVNSELSRATQLPDYHSGHPNYHGDYHSNQAGAQAPAHTVPTSGPVVDVSATASVSAPAPAVPVAPAAPNSGISAPVEPAKPA